MTIPPLGNMNADSNSPEGMFLREIASFYRSDGIVVVSSAEADRLRNILGNEFVDQKVRTSHPLVLSLI